MNETQYLEHCKPEKENNALSNITKFNEEWLACNMTKETKSVKVNQQPTLYGVLASFLLSLGS